MANTLEAVDGSNESLYFGTLRQPHLPTPLKCRLGELSTPSVMFLLEIGMALPLKKLLNAF